MMPEKVLGYAGAVLAVLWAILHPDLASTPYQAELKDLLWVYL